MNHTRQQSLIANVPQLIQSKTMILKVLSTALLIGNLVACQANITTDSKGAETPPITKAKASGMIKGTTWNFTSGTAKIEKNSAGEPSLSMSLSPKSLVCGEFAPVESGIVSLNTPASSGVFNFPSALAVISYKSGNEIKNDVASETTVIIDSITSTEVKGRLTVSFEDSKIIGSFTLPICSSDLPPRPQQPIPNPPSTPVIDIKKVLSDWGTNWRGEDSISVPGKYGSLSLFINIDNVPRGSSIVTFQMGGMCSYSEMGKGGVGLQWGSDVNGAYLSADGTGNIFLNCRGRKPYAVGSIDEKQIFIKNMSCTDLMNGNTTADHGSFSAKATGSRIAFVTNYFPDSPAVGNFPASPAVTCSGQIKR